MWYLQFLLKLSDEDWLPHPKLVVEIMLDLQI